MSPSGPRTTRSPAPRSDGRGDESDVRASRTALLAAEALSLVVRSCSTAPAVRALQSMARSEVGLLRDAAARCRHVEALDARVRQAGARLLLDAAEDLGSQHRGDRTGRAGRTRSREAARRR